MADLFDSDSDDRIPLARLVAKDVNKPAEKQVFKGRNRLVESEDEVDKENSSGLEFLIPTESKKRLVGGISRSFDDDAPPSKKHTAVATGKHPSLFSFTAIGANVSFCR
jgi:hypothetical protein